MVCFNENLDRRDRSGGIAGVVTIFPYHCGVYIVVGRVIFHSYLERM